jgi:hypothetical protein
MSATFTRFSRLLGVNGMNSFQNNGLEGPITSWHDSCIGTPRKPASLLGKVWFGIMVSVWWIVWAFLIGGYAGMLLVALVVLARKVRAPG